MRSRVLIIPTIILLVLFQASAMPLTAASPSIAIHTSSQFPSIYQGESVEISVTFTNIGSDTASHITVSLVSLPTGFLADSLAKSGGSLSPQAQPGNVTFNLRTSNSISPGTYQINVQVSADNTSTQSGSVTLQVLQNPIAISLLTPSVSVVQVDKPQTFNVVTKVDNVASTPLGDLSLTLMVDTSAFTAPSGPVPPPPTTLAAQGSTGILNYTLGTLPVSKPGYRNITLVVGFGTADGRKHTISGTTSVFFKNWYDPGKFGCLIATATYGSELAPEVQLLRNFRDNSIMKTQSGSSFMIAFNAWYYSFSPIVAGYLAQHWVERTIMKGVLYPLIGILYLTATLFTATSGVPELAVLVSGLLASSLIGAFYVGIPLALARAKVRRLRGNRMERRVERVLAVSLLGGVAALSIGEIFNSVTLLMLSSAGVVLLTLFLSATKTSEMLVKIAQRH
jgi:hypothetical protein